MFTAIIIKMKKIFIIFIFSLVFLPFYTEAESADIIIMVDSSSSMGSCFDDVVSYLVDDLLETQVHSGDVFHLIHFSGNPVHELSQKIFDNRSFSVIIKEIMFLKEKVLFGRYTDLMSAMEKLYVYIGSLPEERPKKVFLLTDIKHDPPESSPYSDRDPALIKSTILQVFGIIHEYNGWYVLSIQIPGKSDFAKTALYSEVTTNNVTNMNTISLQYPAGQDQLTELIEILGIGPDDLRKDNTEFLQSSKKGSRQLFSGFISPRILYIVIIFGIVIVSIILAILLFMIFTWKKKFEKAFKNIFNPGKLQENLVSMFRSDIPLIEMRVSFQNPHIGFRNTHKVKESKTLSIGGGLSQYLIFLIPMPPHIAEISRENGKYIFNPLKKEYFPDLKGPVIDCLNKEIPVVSTHGYRSQIVFKKYISPLTRLHELLHSITYNSENTLELLHTHKLALSAIIVK